MTHNDASYVAGLELADGEIQGLLHVGVDALGDELVQVDAAPEQLDVSLLEQRLVAIGPRIGEYVGARGEALDAKPLVQEDAGRELLVVGEYLLAELVDELVEAEVHLGLDLVVEELLAEDGQGVEGAVVVQVQRVEDVPGREREGCVDRYLNGGDPLWCRWHQKLKCFLRPHDQGMGEKMSIVREVVSYN